MQSILRYSFATLNSVYRPRNLIFQFSNEKFLSEVHQGKISGYAGFDPSAESLHLGNFLPIINLLRLAQLGVTPIFLIGGATGGIGDPSGKSQERSLLDIKTIEYNQTKIHKSLECIINNIRNYQKQYSDQGILDNLPHDFKYEIINNIDFYRDQSVLDFLRDIGKHFRVSNLLGKESISTRLTSQEVQLQAQGISFTEFTYQLFQAHDFYTLYKEKNCILQIGGSDQWGNMTSGCEYIRKKGGEAYCFTIPLLLNSSGKKFGKSESGAVFLDKNPFSIQQYLINTADEDLEKYLKMFTFLKLDYIEQQMILHHSQPELKIGQNLFVKHMMEMIFGAEDPFSNLFFSNDFSTFFGQSQEFIESFFKQLENFPLKKQINADKNNTLNILFELGIAKSKQEIRKMVDNGIVTINGQKLSMDVVLQPLDRSYLLNDKYMVVKVGKKKYYYANIL